jgi:uncharacterized protein YozE (UPF0346 family)
MRRLSSKELIKEIPDVQSIVLPENWFGHLDINANKSVFSSLYEWMLAEGEVPEDYKRDLHNITYIGNSIYKKLLSAEKKRLRQKLKISKEKLDEAVSWSDINTGPKTLIGELEISGDCILVIPESSRTELSSFAFKVFKKEIRRNVNKSKDKAAGATFYQWLISQIDRPDNVGDIARDAKTDKTFPNELQAYQEYENYLSKLGACSAAIESLKDAWLEYFSQYPERINSVIWCYECGNKFEPEYAKISYAEEAYEIFVLCDNCEEKYKGFYELISLDASSISQETLEDFCEDQDISKFTIDEIVEKLKLWGVLPTVEKGTVYFLKSPHSHEIKIGFTSGEVSKRLSSLQTSHPYQLELLTTIPGNTDLERSLHQQFEQYRLRGEWFKPHPEIISYISNIKQEKCTTTGSTRTPQTTRVR